uniref:Uncharacterized protein n=1 Tax=Populus trichocarpa TaxID=3694 RepID=A0A2K1X6V0_POPTR
MNSRWMAFCSFPLCGRQPLAHPNPILYTSILHIGKIRGRKVTRLYNIRMQAEVYRILVLASKEEVVACRDQRMVVGEDQGVQEVQEVEVDGGDDGVVDDQRVLAEAVVVQKDLVVECQRAEVGEAVQNDDVVGCQRVDVEEEVAVQKDLVVEEVGVYGMSFSLKPSVANTLVFNFICGNVTKASSVHKMKNRTSYIRVDKKEEV